jgi:uncharacterized protein YyaL (SSP411 family)
VPSGNGTAARALLHLGHLLGEVRYVDAAERTLRAAHATLEQMPQACASLLRALNDYLHPRTHVVVRSAGDSEQGRWRDAFAGAGVVDGRIDAYVIAADAPDLPGALAAQAYRAGGVAYVCRGTRCLAPLEDATALGAALGSAQG